MRFKGVLFDLDGTLLDTLQDLADSVNRVLAAHGWPVHPAESYRYFVGEGARNLVDRALPPDARDAATLSAVLEEYRADYAQTWKVSTKPYDGILPMLDALQDAGIALGVLSNKPHALTREVMAGYLGQYRWSIILGQREDVPRKPDPAGAFEVARHMGLAPADILYIGDTGTDMKTARAAGMFPLGVLWGFRPREELERNGAAALIQHPREVWPYVAG